MVTRMLDADSVLAELFGGDPPQDPYEAYARLREVAPVHRSALLDGGWVCTRYEDVVGVLRGPNWSSQPDPAGGWGGADAEQAAGVVEVLGRVLLFMDDPAHARLRGLVASAFTPRAVERLRPRVVELVDEVLAAAGDGPVELMADVAFDIPVIVIAELLGVPAADRHLFRQYVPKLTPLLEMGVSPEYLEGALEAFLFFAGYFGPMFDERRAHPTDDLISRLVHAEIDGERLDVGELVTTCVLLLGAGHETTMNLIGNGLYALLRNPDELAALRDGDVAARPAVEELLRYDSPVQLTVRRAVADTTVGGQAIAAGREVMVLLGAANRDPAAFADPDRLDLRRDPHHLAFSNGAHYCLGAALARLEAEIAVPAILRRWPSLSLAAEPTYRPTRTLRGLTALHLDTGSA